MRAEFRVNTSTLGDQNDPKVAATTTGFVVVWESQQFDGDLEAVVMQFLDQDGMPVGGETLVNTYTTNNQEQPDVSPDGAGGFVVVWESEGQIDDGTQYDDVFARHIDTAGQLVGAEFQVNTQSSIYQENGSVAGANGRFLVVWQSAPDFDGSLAGVFGQLYEEDHLFADGFESGDLTAWSSSVQ